MTPERHLGDGSRGGSSPEGPDVAAVTMPLGEMESAEDRMGQRRA